VRVRLTCRLDHGGSSTYNIKHEKESKCLRVFGKLIEQKSGITNIDTLGKYSLKI
jgi:hypothetical protein